MHAIKDLFLESINCCHTGMNVILKIIAVCHFGKLKWLALKWGLGDFRSVLVIASPVASVAGARVRPACTCVAHWDPCHPSLRAPAQLVVLLKCCHPAVPVPAYRHWERLASGVLLSWKERRPGRRQGRGLPSLGWAQGDCILYRSQGGHTLQQPFFRKLPLVHVCLAWAGWHFSRTLSVVLCHPSVFS